MRPPDVTGIHALYFNCTLKRSPEPSHTQLLIDRSMAIVTGHGGRATCLRPVDYDLAVGVQPDMTEHGWPSDAWPDLFAQVREADILVLATPIWLGEKSSVATGVIERLYGNSGMLNAAGQSVYYGKAGGCLVTGNEDGIKHCAMGVLYALSHLGYTIPPQADAGWIGEAGPGRSYGEDGAGFDNDFTNRNTTIMTWNLLHTAAALRQRPLPAYGNDRRAWAAGERFGFPSV